jgi:hypothetical protein
MTNFQKKIKAYSRPADKEWWDGRSNKEAISRWQERTSENSDGARHRASTAKEPTLPDTGKMEVHSTHQPAGSRSDPYEAAKRDLNRDLNNGYQRGIRRTT